MTCRHPPLRAAERSFAARRRTAPTLGLRFRGGKLRCQFATSQWVWVYSWILSGSEAPPRVAPAVADGSHLQLDFHSPRHPEAQPLQPARVVPQAPPALHEICSEPEDSQNCDALSEGTARVLTTQTQFNGCPTRLAGWIDTKRTMKEQNRREKRQSRDAMMAAMPKPVVSTGHGSVWTARQAPGTHQPSKLAGAE